MDITRAKEIISILAEGIDPTTGELLSNDNVCNKGEVVRALYTVLKACEDGKTKNRINKKNPDDYDVVLYNRLKELRNKIAAEKKMLPFMVLPNYPLMHMAAEKPITVEAFSKIYGVGEYTTKQYSKVFITEIKNYLEKKI